MIIQLTVFESNRPVYFNTEDFSHCYIVGTAKPHTYIACKGNKSLQVSESPELVCKLVIGDRLTDEEVIKHCMERG